MPRRFPVDGEKKPPKRKSIRARFTGGKRQPDAPKRRTAEERATDHANEVQDHPSRIESREIWTAWARAERYTARGCMLNIDLGEPPRGSADTSTRYAEVWFPTRFCRPITSGTATGGWREWEVAEFTLEGKGLPQQRTRRLIAHEGQDPRGARASKPITVEQAARQAEQNNVSRDEPRRTENGRRIVSRRQRLMMRRVEHAINEDGFDPSDD